MTVLPPSHTPQDMRDLLIRLDQRVADGFEHNAAAFKELRDANADLKRDQNETKARVTKLEDGRPILIDQHNKMLKDVSDLKDWRTEIAGAVKMGNVMKGAVALMVAVMLYVGYKVEFAPTTTKVTTSTQVQTSKP